MMYYITYVSISIYNIISIHSIHSIHYKIKAFENPMENEKTHTSRIPPIFQPYTKYTHGLHLEHCCFPWSKPMLFTKKGYRLWSQIILCTVMKSS